ncbi:MAG: GH25 family lysozyme [Parvibaculaceae bacterium]
MAVIAVAVGVLAASLGAGAALARMLSDKNPHSGVAEAHTMPVQGIDVSYWQGDIDWKKVGDAGIHFAYIKATEGGDRLDPKFLDNWRAAKKAGIARGAYHFMYWCRSAKEQASWFASHVPGDDDALPPVLDVEWNPHSKTCPQRIARDAAIAKIKVMLKAMEAHSGKQPIIYTDPKFHREVLEGEFPDHHFWLRSVAAMPEAKYPARNWVFWQFTTTGRVHGVAGPVDRNSFNGTRADWKSVLKKQCLCGTAPSMSSND